MPALAIALLVVSSVLHVGWNAVGKRARPTPAFFLVANATAALAMLPILATHTEVLAAAPSLVWILVFATGAAQATYCIGLAGAYRTGDLSLAYPLIRALPALLVGAASLALGRGDAISGLAIAGVFLIAGGAFVLPVRRLRDVRAADYATVTMAFALLAIVGTVGYSLIDDRAIRAFIAARPGASSTGTVFTFVALTATSTSLWMLVVTLARSRGRRDLASVWRTGRRTASVTGIAIYLTYGLVIAAMPMVADIAYVVAFRQLSIPLAALVGVRLLGEPSYLGKWLGVAAIFTGVVTLALA